MSCQPYTKLLFFLHLVAIFTLARVVDIELLLVCAAFLNRLMARRFWAKGIVCCRDIIGTKTRCALSRNWMSHQDQSHSLSWKSGSSYLFDYYETNFPLVQISQGFCSCRTWPRLDSILPPTEQFVTNLNHRPVI